MYKKIRSCARHGEHELHTILGYSIALKNIINLGDFAEKVYLCRQNNKIMETSVCIQ